MQACHTQHRQFASPGRRQTNCRRQPCAKFRRSNSATKPEPLVAASRRHLLPAQHTNMPSVLTPLCQNGACSPRLTAFARLRTNGRCVLLHGFLHPPACSSLYNCSPRPSHRRQRLARKQSSCRRSLGVWCGRCQRPPMRLDALTQGQPQQQPCSNTRSHSRSNPSLSHSTHASATPLCPCKARPQRLGLRQAAALGPGPGHQPQPLAAPAFHIFWKQQQSMLMPSKNSR